MTYTYTHDQTHTFAITHARNVSSKIAADMHLCALYYGHPAEARVRAYAEEIAQLMKGAFLERFDFGFRHEGKWSACWRYRFSSNGAMSASDRPGKILSTADVAAATFYTYLVKSENWLRLTPAERQRIEAGLPVQRGVADPPGETNGYWTSDKSFSSGGYAARRETFRRF